MADTLCWHLHESGIPLIMHYLDDFIIVGPPQSVLCAESLNQECQALGVPIADHKQDSPTTCLTYLGIEMDTAAGQLRLPADKLRPLQALLQFWGARHSGSWKDLESLIGLLNHACNQAGISVRSMLDLLHAVHSPLNSPCLSGSMPWFGQTWPGGGHSWNAGMGCHSSSNQPISPQWR